MMNTVFLCSAAVLFTVVTGQDLVCSGSCVARWEQCAGNGIASGTIMPCCSDDDHCVEQTVHYSQCLPKAQGVPSSWPSGAILNCAGQGSGCDDPAAVTVKWVKVAATGTRVGRLALGSMQELDGCAEACAANDDCYAFSEYEFARGGENCDLWARGLITTAPLINGVDNEPNLEPSHFTNISFVKCFTPPALCDPAGEVREIGADTGPFFKYTDGGFSGFDRNRAESFYTTGDDADTFTACITVCRLSQSPSGVADRLHCIGFALDVEEVEGAQRTLCTLLYGNSDVVTEYVPTAESRIFTLDDCPTSTELGEM